MNTIVAKYGTALAGLAVFIFFLLFANNFASVSNLLLLGKNASLLAMLGVGFTFALLTSELDLSFASICSLAAVIVGGLIHADVYWPIAAIVGIAVGLAGGVINGLLVVYAKVPSLIATLGTASIATGCAFMLTHGVAFVGQWDK